MISITEAAMEDYFQDVFYSFKADPQDSDYHRGYREAMIEIAKETCSKEFLKTWGINV